jgi:hypothetical protein
MNEKQTQGKLMLNILNRASKSGITAEGIRNIAWIPQYNRVIKDLRREGHVIESRKLRNTITGKIEYKFFYIGQNKARLKEVCHDHKHDGHGNLRFTID